MTEEMQTSLGEALGQLSEDADSDAIRRQNFDLRLRLEKQSRGNENLLAVAKERESELAAAYTELSLYKSDFTKRPNWLLPKKGRGKDHHGTLVAMLSDTHYAEVVREGELGGYNKYNMKVAEQRTQKFFERTVSLARNYLAGVTYDGIVLPLAGDLVSGSIHDELIETNEQSVYRTCELVVPWLARGIEMLMGEFKNVHVVSAPGNHGRNTVKPRHKKRSENNADTHIANILAGIVFSGEPSVTFDIPESSDVDFAVYDSIFSVEHGDNLRFNGTSEIGSLGPVKRGNLRKTKKRQEQGRPFRYGMYGHFHQYVPAYTQGFVMNGSLKGYDEYASDGQFTPEPPQQALLIVTPERGITGAHQIEVLDRKREGW